MSPKLKRGVVKGITSKMPNPKAPGKDIPGRVFFGGGVSHPTFDEALLDRARILRGHEAEFTTDEGQHDNLLSIVGVVERVTPPEPVPQPRRVEPPIEPRITDSKDKDRIVAVVEKISRDFAELADAIKKEGRW